jgi:calcium/calmodulin-dependent protein kinase I
MDSIPVVAFQDKNIGKVVGSYKIVQYISSGKAGMVYKAVKDGEYYAAKIIPIASIKTEKQMILLNNELKASTGIKHPNIINMKEYFQSETNYYFIFELCDGLDLTSFITSPEYKPFDEQNSIAILKQICNGYNFIHKNGILHRDIKLDNIFRKTEGSSTILKIGDFGFSKIIDSSSIDNFMNLSYLGTPYYTAPEILRKEPYKYKCDIFAIGVTFFGVLTGLFAFPEKNPVLFNNLVRTGDINFWNPVPLSDYTIDFIVKCLKYNPDERMSNEEMMGHPLIILDYESISKRMNFTLNLKVNINEKV